VSGSTDGGVNVNVRATGGGPIPVSVASLPLPAGAATEASLGTDGAGPPSIPGTGIRGWLRSIYDTLKATLTVAGIVSILHSLKAPTVLTFTSATATSTNFDTDVTGYESVLLTILTSGSISGGGSTTFALLDANGNVGLTYLAQLGIGAQALPTNFFNLGSTTGRSFLIPVSGASKLRVTTGLAAYSGAGSISFTINPSTAKLPNASQVQMVGTLSAGGAPSSGQSISALPAVANANPPTDVETALSYLSVDLAGNLRAKEINSAGIKADLDILAGTVAGGSVGVSAAALPLPAGASTSAKQDTELASLASMDSKMPTVGQKTMAASQPVVLASDQSAVLINNQQWGGTPVAAAATAAPVGTEAAPVVRDIFTKRGQILTTTPLGISATYTSAWFDSNLDGTVFVEASATSDHGNATANTFLIEQTDDPNVAVFTVSGTGGGAWPANVNSTVGCCITRRYWRVRAVNGAIANTTQEITMVSTGITVQTLVGQGANGAPTPLATGGTSGVLALNWTTSVGDSYPTGAGVPNPGGSTTVLPAGLFLCSGANGAGNWSAKRNPNIFKTASATATGSTAVWTPTSGKKFRVMRFKIQVTANAAIAAGGVLSVKLLDSAADLSLSHDIFLPSAAGTTMTGAYDSGWIDLENGPLSALANNVLNVNLSAALTSGNVRVIVCGTEE
jgi:hypothetical protein